MDRIWLRHPQTDGYFHCPAPAIDDWLELGWERADEPPAEANPVVAERIGWEQQQQAPVPTVSTKQKTARQSAATTPEEK